MTDWKTTSIGELSELVTKGTTPTSVGHKFTDQGINFVKVESITQNGIFRTEKLAHIDDDCHQTLKRSQLVNGDILFSIAGALGRTARVTSNILPANTNQALAIIRLKPSEEVLPEFIIRALSSGMLIEQIEKQRGGVAQQNLSLAQVKNFQIPLPPLPEQKRIVAILDEAFAGIDAAIANTEKNLANARELFESYMNAVFTQKGDGWVEKKLGEVYDVRDGTHDSPKYQEKGYPLITSKNLKRDGLNFERVKYVSEVDYLKINERSAVHRGDILFAMIGTIGNPIVVEVEPSFAIKNVALFKVPNNQNNYFLKLYLQSAFVTSKMQREAKGTTQKFVGLGYLRNFPIFVPDLPKQNEIVARVMAIQEETDRLETIYRQKLNALTELKQSILQKAFTGELTTLAEKTLDEAVA
jgi:type I restriction enzyme S subunit